MRPKDKSFAIGIAVSFALSAIVIASVFYTMYYLFPSHAWITNGVVNETLRLRVYDEAFTTSLSYGGAVFLIGLGIAMIRYALTKNNTDSDR